MNLIALVVLAVHSRECVPSVDWSFHLRGCVPSEVHHSHNNLFLHRNQDFFYCDPFRQFLVKWACLNLPHQDTSSADLCLALQDGSLLQGMVE